MFLQCLAIDDDVVQVYYTSTNRSKYGWNSLFMRVQKVAGALVRPKGMTKNSNAPYRVTHVVFGSLPSAMRTW